MSTHKAPIVLHDTFTSEVEYIYPFYEDGYIEWEVKLVSMDVPVEVPCPFIVVLNNALGLDNLKRIDPPTRDRLVWLGSKATKLARGEV